MKAELAEHFQNKNLKSYFDKVYTGHYDEKVFNEHLNVNETLKKIKE